ncbi:PKD domain-containing protein, partial [Vibrio alfacsensis]
AGADQSVQGPATVILDASASRDSDGSIVSYSWVQTGGDAVVLVGSDTVQASFDAQEVTATQTYQFTVTVTDNEGATATDVVM